MSVKTIKLRIPILSALDWGQEWTDLAFYRAIQDTEVGMDAGEPEGKWEERYFWNLTAEALRDLTADVLDGKASAVKVTGKRTVTVEAPDPGWLLGPSQVRNPYDEAAKRLSKRLSEDPTWSAWWASTGYGHLLISQQSLKQLRPDQERFTFSPDEQGDLHVWAFLDLSAMNSDDPEMAAEGSRRNLALILDLTADHLGKPHPQLRAG